MRTRKPELKNDGLLIDEGDEAGMINPGNIREIKKRRINMVLIIVVWWTLFSLIFLGIILPPKDNFFAFFPTENSSSGSSPVIQPASLLRSTPAAFPQSTPLPNPIPASFKPTLIPETPVPVKTAAAEILKLPIGEGASDGIKSVMVYSAKKTDRYSYSEANKTKVETAPKGKIFVIVYAGIKNVGAPVLTVNSTPFSITDSNHFKYDPYFLYNGTDGLKIQQLYVDQVSIGKILFVVPEGSDELRLQYDFGDLVSSPNLAEWPVN
jgi:hypothetical protein